MRNKPGLRFVQNVGKRRVLEEASRGRQRDLCGGCLVPVMGPEDAQPGPGRGGPGEAQAHNGATLHGCPEIDQLGRVRVSISQLFHGRDHLRWRVMTVIRLDEWRDSQSIGDAALSQRARDSRFAVKPTPVTVFALDEVQPQCPERPMVLLIAKLHPYVEHRTRG